MKIRRWNCAPLRAAAVALGVFFLLIPLAEARQRRAKAGPSLSQVAHLLRHGGRSGVRVRGVQTYRGRYQLGPRHRAGYLSRLPRGVRVRTTRVRLNRKRTRAFDKMLDRIWAQKVERHDPARRSDNHMSQGFSGSVKLVDGKVVKTVAPELDSTFGWKVGRREMKKLFLQEVAIQSAVSRVAPGLTPRVLSSDPKRWTFAMELVPGKHLYEMTRADLNPGALGRFERKLARVHRAGIGHGDIKPANIMAQKGELRLIDWGTGRYRLKQGGTETVMDKFLRRTMKHPGPVDLVAFDRRALKRVRRAVNNLPASR